jgi:hypothetical protein
LCAREPLRIRLRLGRGVGTAISMRQAENQFLIAPLSLIVLLSASSILGGAGGFLPTIPIPGAGQWVDFGRNEPPINNGAFTFPGPSGVAGYFYTKPPATIRIFQIDRDPTDQSGPCVAWLVPIRPGATVGRLRTDNRPPGVGRRSAGRARRNGAEDPNRA